MSRPGFSVLELLVAIASSLMIIAAIGGFARAESRAFGRELRAIELREASRRALEMMAREVRATGYAPVAAGGFDGVRDGLSIARRDRIEVRADWHGMGGTGSPDGLIDEDSAERIGFFHNSTRGLLSQTLGRQTLPLTADGRVPTDGLAFRYFDACDAELVPASGAELSLDEKTRVRRVDIELTTADGGQSLTARVSAALRNRGGLRCS